MALHNRDHQRRPCHQWEITPKGNGYHEIKNVEEDAYLGSRVVDGILTLFKQKTPANWRILRVAELAFA
jgi:hypothetical protein